MPYFFVTQMNDSTYCIAASPDILCMCGGKMDVIAAAYKKRVRRTSSTCWNNNFHFEIIYVILSRISYIWLRDPDRVLHMCSISLVVVVDVRSISHSCLRVVILHIFRIINILSCKPNSFFCNFAWPHT